MTFLEPLVKSTPFHYPYYFLINHVSDSDVLFEIMEIYIDFDC